MERLHAIIEGRVQGVGYRYWAARTARALGLTGWVRNLSDGRVELTAEGPRPVLNDLLGLIREGPVHADVASVRPEYAPASGEFTRFEIR